MVNATEQTHRYRVRVGHFEVLVIAHDEAEAISLTRRQLALELPRFYDLIRALHTEHFELQKAA
jgi:hypothetical protein